MEQAAATDESVVVFSWRRLHRGAGSPASSAEAVPFQGLVVLTGLTIMFTAGRLPPTAALRLPR